MVNFALPTLAALAMASLTGAAPTAAQSDAVEIFSFSKWVDGIIANPEGDNLTPEEAVEAWQASINATETAVETAAEGLTQKRWVCATAFQQEAWAPDAVWCIDYLARLGGTPCKLNDFASTFCTYNRGQITGGATLEGRNAQSACNDVARGAGIVMDKCTRGDQYVQGSEFAWGNGYLLVNIHKPR